MCLVTKNLKPYVAKENIKVFKIIQKDGDRYKTPYIGQEVELGTSMKPKEDVNQSGGNIGHDDCALCVENGFIHAITDAVAYDNEKTDDTENYIVVEAYIPQGTEFHLSDDFIEIAAKELFITDKIVERNPKLSEEELKNFLLEYPIENLISKDKVSVGWLMLDNKTFVHPSFFDKETMQAVGIVCEVDEDDCNVMSLEETTKRWGENLVKVEGEEAYTDRKGQEYCKIISKQDGYNNGDFPAVKWCLEYQTEGTKKGDWYLPASGELRNAILNMHIINAVLLFSSVGVTLLTSSYYWSSSEYSYGHARIVYPINSHVGYGSKDYNYYVRPFLRVSGEEVVRG